MDNERNPVQDFYENFYSKVFVTGNSFSNWSYKKTHVAIEKPTKNRHFSNCLEIGAGNGEHLPFVAHTYDRYFMVDRMKPNSNHVPKHKDVEFIVQDIELCDFGNLKFDRVLMSCVLHHLDNPWKVLKLVESWLNEDGVFTFFLSSDPGVVNRLFRRMCVTPKARQLGFYNYPLVNALEHKNHYWSLVSQIQNVFREYSIRRRYYPLNIPIASLSLFSVWEIRKPHVKDVSY